MAIEPKSRGNIVRFESDNVNKTYRNNTNNPWISVMITNDGASDITLVINNISIIVKSGETYDDDFVGFTSLNILASVAFRLWLRS